MSRVFISHASADLAVAEHVHAYLSGRGEQVFLDRSPRDGLMAGEEWEKRLLAELRAADAVVCVVSPRYAASKWCEWEALAAKVLGAQILPLSIEPGAVYAPLSALQHEDYAADADRSLEAIAGRLGYSGAPAGWDDTSNPFPGLRPFDASRQRFTGRAQDTEALAKLTRSVANAGNGEMVTVVGASGSGKSSLVRAGCCPR